MTVRAGVATIGMLMMLSPAPAAGLCRCCDGSSGDSCRATCAQVTPPAGQCLAAVDYDGRSEVAPGMNPLYDLSWRNIWLGRPNASQIESFRRLLESARSGAERDRKAALRDRRRNVIDAATAAQMAKRYDDAIVNYYLGLHAYRSAKP